MNQNGGRREGAGRKPKHDEEKTANICKAAIAGKYGTLEKGVEWLLGSGEPALIKFVYEHALGKPKEKMELSGELGVKTLVVKKASGKGTAAK